MEFSKQEYWGGLLFPFPGDLPYPGIKPRSSALQADSLPSEPWGRRENSSIAFWSHQSRSVDINSNPLPDLHKFLFQMETGGRVHSPHPRRGILHGMSTDSLNIVHYDLWRNGKNIYHFWKSFLFSMALINHSCHALWKNDWTFYCYYILCQCSEILVDDIFVAKKRLTRSCIFYFW